MKHLDTLLDELQHPVDIVQAWCDEDKDRAVVACLIDIDDEQLWEVFSEAYPNDTNDEIAEKIEDTFEEIYSAESEDRKPNIDYEKLYSPLEHIINDRIEVYNKS